MRTKGDSAEPQLPVDRAQFSGYVTEALAHLYDYVYLQTHPLAALLEAGPQHHARGRTLHRLLMETIETLKPEDEVPFSSPAWRKYRYLTLRYIEETPPGEVARELDISERQCRRDHHDSVNAIASHLWGIYQSIDAGDKDAGTAPDRKDQPERYTSLVAGEIARLEREVDGSTTSLSQVVERTLRTVAPLANRQGVTLKSEIQPELSLSTISWQALRQIVLNMALVALERTDDGSIVFRARRHGNQVKLSVAADLPRAPRLGNDRLLPADADRLAVISRLVEMYQGEVEPFGDNRGSFDLTVALPDVESHTVVVIEDNPDLRRLIGRYLVAGGFQMVEATNISSAIDVIKRTHPIAVTVDVLMPNQDGWEILQALKAHPDTRAVPVIVCTVLRESELAIALGADAWLGKPITQSGLLTALARAQSMVRPRSPGDLLSGTP